MIQQKTIDNLNSMLRGELAATETYQQALEKVSSGELGSIMDDHREAANEFRRHVHDFGGEPEQDSGVWGTFARAVTGTAKLFGPTAALKALKKGEEQGISSYEHILQDPDLPQECRTLVSSTMMRGRSHLTVLDRLMSQPRG